MESTELVWIDDENGWPELYEVPMKHHYGHSHRELKPISKRMNANEIRRRQERIMRRLERKVKP